MKFRIGIFVGAIYVAAIAFAHFAPQKLKLVLTDGLSITANIFTSIAGALAVWIYLDNRGSILKAIQVLLNFSFQTTLSELKEKLERLNEYNANEPTETDEIKNILHEIAGQIKGNKQLRSTISDLAASAEVLADTKRKLTEPSKRSFVSEMREQLKNIQVETTSKISGE